jgi:SPP1 gp7 family putative phage head morphogenesis protein
MAVNDKILDDLTRHQVYIQRFSNSTVRKVLSVLRRSDARIVERLLRNDLTALSRRRQERLLTEMRRNIESAFEDATGALHLELEGLAAYEGEYQLDMFRRVLPVALDTVTPSAEQIMAAVNGRPFQGRLLREVYQDLPRTTFRRLRETIRAGIIEGRTTDEIVRDIRGRKSQGFKDGVLGRGRRDTEAVVRTAVNHTANTAREYTYERNDDLVKGVRWNSTLDSRTSSVCRARDGKIYEPGKGPRPPAHFNCRSSTSPVIKSWRELGIDLDEAPEGTRASMNGQVPADQDYDTWLRKQPREFQNEVLGPARAKLFRSGMKVDRFVDRKGRELTLDQIRSQEKPRSPKAKVVPKKKRELSYKKFKGVQSLAQAQDEIESKGIAAVSALKGVTLRGLNIIISASMEAKERFNLGRLDFIGPFSRDNRYRYPKVQNANAAVSPEAKAMHIPVKFGEMAEAQRQIDLKKARASKFEDERFSELHRSSDIPDEVRRRVEKMAPGDYTWSITAETAEAERAKTIFHEYGHVLHLIEKEPGRKINAFLAADRPLSQGWQLLVSKYAGANDYEYIAETFAIYMTRPVSEHYRIHPNLLAIYRELDVEYDA